MDEDKQASSAIEPISPSSSSAASDKTPSEQPDVGAGRGPNTDTAKKQLAFGPKAVLEDVTVAVCMMDSKLNTPQTKALIDELGAKGFKIVVIAQGMMAQPIKQWPPCDALLAIDSKGFPLGKVLKYAKLRKVIQLNCLKMQRILRDRSKINDVLREHGVETPRHITVLPRDVTKVRNAAGVIVSLTIDGVSWALPFAVKLLDAENHHVIIYFADGWQFNFWRKVGDVSGDLTQTTDVVIHEGGSVVELLVDTTEDVKVYFTGAFAVAEKRASPHAAGGKVARDENGKEARVSTELSEAERDMVEKVSRAFKQVIIGLDILRDAKTKKSSVIDVNGWSNIKTKELIGPFVKEAAQIIYELVKEGLQLRAASRTGAAGARRRARRRAARRT